MMTAAFLGMGQNLITSVFSSNILVSLADKIISAFVALGILEALPPSLTKYVQITGAPRIQRIAWIAGGIVVSLLIIFIVAYAVG